MSTAGARGGSTLSTAHARRLLRRWDAQQESFNPTRELRFRAMFDIVEVSVGRKFSAVDLGSGPGSLSARLLGRFPSARCTAVDYDPVTQLIGRRALGTQRGRLSWADADLGTPGWSRRLPRSTYSAALSTTALHWLTSVQLRKFYAELRRVLRPGGVFLNGDYLPPGPTQPRVARLVDRVHELQWKREGTTARSRWRPWELWWTDARRVPALSESFRLREGRGFGHPHHAPTTLEVHRRALLRSGFKEPTPVWDFFGNRILVAWR